MLMNRKSPNVFADVAQFTELAHPNMLPKSGRVVNPKAIELAIKLIEEECNKEYIPALQAFQQDQSVENLLAVVDGAMDSIYVIVWAMKILGVENPEAYWNEVQRSNMAKFKKGVDPIPLDLPEYKDVDSEVNYRNGYAVLTNAKTGKVMKPEGWTPPNLHQIFVELSELKIALNRKKIGQPSIHSTFIEDYFYTTEQRLSEEQGKG